MTAPKTPSCNICERPVELRPANPYFPFCSARCKDVDLGQWFQEEYRVSVTEDSTERSLPNSPQE